MLPIGSGLRDGVERLGQIREQILGNLTACAQADKPCRNHIATPTGTPFCRGVHAAKTRGFVYQLAGRKKRFRPRAMIENETDHGSEPLHLAPSDGVSGIPGQTRVSNA